MVDIFESDERIVKVPLPISLIRRMDEMIVSGKVGFRSRAELIREAVENLLNELAYPEAPAESPTRAPDMPLKTLRVGMTDDILLGIPDDERAELVASDLSRTRLVIPPKPHMVRTMDMNVRDTPLLGLHNRDYASLWALARLATYTQNGAVLFPDYLKRATKAAWYFGAQLSALEVKTRQSGFSTLFPTNPAKQPSAERGFQSFAIGTVAKGSGGDESPRVGGPLFLWRAVQVMPGNLVGLTEAGWGLLQSLSGLSLNMPHGAAHAERFLDHLETFARSDKWGFDHLLMSALDEPDREGLVARFARSHPHWTVSTASSVAQGYVARSREWGLLEPKLVEGRYRLTVFGRKQQEEISTNYMDTINDESEGERS